MNWHEIKVATLQKMVSADGNTIPQDKAATEYIAAMPQAANEALALLCNANRFLRQYAEVEAQASENGFDYYFDMTGIADFYELGEIEVYAMEGERIRTVSNVAVRAGRYISFPEAGTYHVFYNAWPEPITQKTSDKYELPLDPDVAVLLPLYMASQIYKDDDISMATVYRNEFDAARMELRSRTYGTQRDIFISKSGW